MHALLANCLRAFVLGLLLGAVYDVIRLSRIIFGVSVYSNKNYDFSLYSRGVKNIFSRKRGNIFTSIYLAVTDLLFCLLSAVIFILYMYIYNYGIFRWFILIFTALGFLFYYKTVGRLFVSVSTVISSYLMLSLNLALFAALYPFRLLKRLLLRMTRPLISDIKSALDKLKNKMYTLKCIKKIQKHFDV
ncbi:MAG: spore cortex biosynthesis protein YabQ [Clostridia bacterium]|nr:spore cortex biosynthesis protein YabQ [Clostridia bacterium]